MSIRSLENSEIALMNLDKMNTLSLELPKINLLRSTLAEQYFTKSTQRATNLTNLDAKKLAFALPLAGYL